MRILLATESYLPNIDGGAVARRNLALRLKEKGHEVGVVAPGTLSKNYEEELDGISVFRIKGRTLPLYPDYKFCVFPFWEVKRIINKFKPDVIDMNSPYQIGMCALACGKKKDIPVIGTIHVQPENMLMSVEKAKFLYGILERMAWSYIMRVFNVCDYVTSPTQTAINLMRTHGLTAKAKPISSGIDLSIFNPLNNGDYLRKRFSIPNEPVVLYTGRISGEKRLDVLVRAFPRVLNAIDTHLVICGSGREKGNIESLVEKLGISENVTFTGFLSQNEFPNIYGIADLFAIPSESELQSIVTMEALASGLPVVAADKHALPELVKNPQNGFLFEPGNTEALSDKIIEILSDNNLKKSMGQKSLEIIQPHSVENTILQFEELYTEAIDNYKRTRKH
ncbi:MAG: glycosyltransferase [Methanomassiliicoccales archaeon]|nr:MAG: glycosyltransferase [Methanomassiliicoccales archaeon]